MLTAPLLHPRRHPRELPAEDRIELVHGQKEGGIGTCLRLRDLDAPGSVEGHAAEHPEHLDHVPAQSLSEPEEPLHEREEMPRCGPGRCRQTALEVRHGGIPHLTLTPLDIDGPHAAGPAQMDLERREQKRRVLAPTRLGDLRLSRPAMAVGLEEVRQRAARRSRWKILDA